MWLSTIIGFVISKRTKMLTLPNNTVNEEKNLSNDLRVFYWYFRPLALMCRAFGTLPLRNLAQPNGSSLQFKFLSWPHFYSLLVFFLTIGSLFYFAKFPFFNYEAQLTIAFIWRCVVTYMMIMRAIICFLFCTIHTKKLVKLIKILDYFERKKHELTTVKEREGLIRVLVWTVLPIVTGLFLMGFIFLELVLFVKPVLPRISNVKGEWIALISFGFLGVWQMVPILLYLYFSCKISYNFYDVNKIAMKIIPIGKLCSDEKIEYFPKMKDSLTYIRHMHIVMAEAVKQLSSSYGSFLAVDQLYTILAFIVNIYVFLFTPNHDVHLLRCTVINGVIALFVIYISHCINDGAIKIVDLLKRIPLSAMDMDSKLEVNMIVGQILASPIRVSAAGYFTMDRTQIPSILTSVATYLIVLIQFSPQLVNWMPKINETHPGLRNNHLD